MEGRDVDIGLGSGGGGSSASTDYPAEVGLESSGRAGGTIPPTLT